MIVLNSAICNASVPIEHVIRREGGHVPFLERHEELMETYSILPDLLVRAFSELLTGDALLLFRNWRNSWPIFDLISKHSFYLLVRTWTSSPTFYGRETIQTSSCIKYLSLFRIPNSYQMVFMLVGMMVFIHKNNPNQNTVTTLME